MKNTYYDYSQDKEIAIDIETFDPNLTKKGPGVYRRDGFILGVSFSNGELSEYYPLRHLDISSEVKSKNIKYTIDQLKANNNKIFANGIYDLDWLINNEEIEVNGAYEDVQIAEPLLDEYKNSYSLDNLAKQYVNSKKEYDEIRQYAINQEWLKPDSKSKGVDYLWKMPSHIVQKYGATDTKLTYKIMQLQREKLKEQNLTDIYNLEMSLFPLLLQMRKTGVRIDEERLYHLGMELEDLKYDLQKEFNELAGFELNINSGKQLEQLFLKNNLEVVYGEPTDLMLQKGIFRGNPRFDKVTLREYNNAFAQKILELRHITTLLNMFIHPYPELMVNGRLHCSFNQLRSDEYGTVSGRFSSSNPNLQQVSGKDESEHVYRDSEILTGQVIRKLFIPEENCFWLKYDWSQIEYRLIAHYAIGEGADQIRHRYSEDSEVDYHEEMGKLAGLEDRKIVKTLNFGAAYGMGVNKMAKTYGWDIEEAREIYNRYHRKVPFVKETSRRVGNKAQRVGFIKTILKRRARMPSSDKAYVMLNRLIQGSAADIMKKAMVDAYKAGLFNVLYPHISVHDELDCSMSKTKEGYEAGKELKNIMENCVKLRVPILADGEIGENWGNLKEWKDA
jgi:DNA polymerase I-like protein with 3'-5' exonuclease and polymerase domains